MKPKRRQRPKSKFPIYKLRVVGSYLYVGPWHVATVHMPGFKFYVDEKDLYRASKQIYEIRLRVQREKEAAARERRLPSENPPSKLTE